MAEQKIILNFRGKRREVNAKICNTLFSKLRGFMFSFSKQPLLFVFNREKPISIHTLFVFQKLLVIWLNENKKIVGVSVMKPFISFKTMRAKYVLEIPLNAKLL